MRKLVTLSILLLSCCSLFAADAPGDRWRISVLASELSRGGDRPWSDDTHAGVGVGIAYAASPSWDVELTVATQTHTSPYTRFFYAPMPDGQPGHFYPATEFHEYRVHPVDLSVTRHFLTGRLIAPYVRAGVRHVGAPNDRQSHTFVAGPNVLIPPQQVEEGFGFSDRTSAQAGAGVRVRLTPRTALRGEATRLLRSEGTDFDPLTRYAIGVSWVF